MSADTATHVQESPRSGFAVSARVPHADRRRRPFGLMGRLMLSMPISTWILLDVGLITLGTYLGYHVHVWGSAPDMPQIAFWQVAFIFGATITVSSLISGLQEPETLWALSRILARLLLTVGLAIVLTYTVVYVVMYASLSRRVAASAIGCYLILGMSIRAATYYSLQGVRQRLLVVGADTLRRFIRHTRSPETLRNYEVLGFVDNDHQVQDVGNYQRLGLTNEIVDLCRTHRIREIVVGEALSHDARSLSWVLPCLTLRSRVTNESTFCERVTGQIPIEEITPHWFLFADLPVHSDERASLKRVCDLAVAVVGLLLTAPFWPLIALIIRLFSKGPAFYAQQRVGQNGKVFTLYKFRTMRADAEANGTVWAKPNDPRVTWVGRILRKTRIDELPQLWNILMGDMSVVGPRPERPEFVTRLLDELPYYAERHLIKPGLTGWAQINFRYGNSVEDARTKLQYDLFYIKHMSLELDLMIFFRTLGTFLKGAW